MPCPGGSAEAETSRLLLLCSLSLVLPLVSAKLATAALLLDRYRSLPTHTQAMAPKQGSVEVRDPPPRPLHLMTASSPPPHPGQRLALLTGHGADPYSPRPTPPRATRRSVPLPSQARAAHAARSSRPTSWSPRPGPAPSRSSPTSSTTPSASLQTCRHSGGGTRSTSSRRTRTSRRCVPPGPRPLVLVAALTPLSTVPLLPRSFACTLTYTRLKLAALDWSSQSSTPRRSRTRRLVTFPLAGARTRLPSAPPDCRWQGGDREEDVVVLPPQRLQVVDLRPVQGERRRCRLGAAPCRVRAQLCLQHLQRHEPPLAGHGQRCVVASEARVRSGRESARD